MVIMSTFDKSKQLWLDNLVLKFYKGHLIFSLDPKDVKFFTWDAQNNFLELTVNSERLEKYPGNQDFTRLFFKKLIDYLQNPQDIHKGFFVTLYAAALKPVKRNKFYYGHYVIGNALSHIITLKETSIMVTNGTTGFKTWEAAKILADWALCNPEEFSYKKVLELGSGVGLTGITIAKFCRPVSMYLTDCHPDVLENIAKNIEINFPESEQEKLEYANIFRDGLLEMGVMHLKWDEFERFPDNYAVPDVIIGAELVCDPSIVEPLCKLFNQFFSSNPELKIYIQSVICRTKTFNLFNHKLGEMNFEVEEIMHKQSSLLDWDEKTESQHLLRITLPSKTN